MIINQNYSVIKNGGDNTALIGLIQRDITTFEIPEGATSIGEYAF